VTPAGPPRSPHASLAGREVVVMGLGRFGGGLGAARYLAELGARVTVTDRRTAPELAGSLDALAPYVERGAVRCVLGEHRERDFERAALVVPNPAVAPGHPLVERARAAGARVRSAVELLVEATPARIAAVTGTQGKSSTCTFLARLLEGGGGDVHLGGNIGGSLLAAAPRMGPDDTVVLELSSYQLEALATDGPHRGRAVAVGVTNVLADHLERHGTRERYAAAKRRLLEWIGRDGTAFLQLDDDVASAWTPARGRTVRFGAGADAELALEADGAFRWAGETLGRCADLRVSGGFQRRNALLALGMARALGVAAEELAPRVARLAGLEHRLQDLGPHRGHRVWDNAVSTTPDSTAAALESLAGPLVLVCGGQAKSLALEPLAEAARGRARLVVAFGADAGRLARELTAAGLACRTCATVERAVELAFDALRPGEELLFSPACASFDAYPNFEERARAFRAALPRRDAEPHEAPRA